MQIKKFFFPALLLIALPWFSGVNRCSPNPSLYTVGGDFTGIGGTVVLQNNGSNDLSLPTNGSFVFTESLGDGSAYVVTVLSHPDNQICSVANGSGTLSGANVSNVAVVCASDGYSVGGTASGLTGTIILQNNDGDNLSVSADGNFTFPTEIANGATYEVSILTQPAGQNCVLSNATGSIDGAAVTNVEVTCENLYSVGGTVSGLFAGYEMELFNNGVSVLTVPGTATGNTSFTLPSTFEDGADYVVTVTNVLQDCDVSDGSGSISGANVSNVTVTCSQRVMFLSDTTYDGNLQGAAISGVVGADAKCAADPQCPAGFVCKAMLGATLIQERTACTTANCSGGPSEHVDWVLLPSTAYVRPDGSTVVGITNENAIFEFDLNNGLSDTQQFAWTGLNRDWTTHFFKCFSWTSNSGISDQGEAGDASAINNTFLDFYNFTGDPLCNTLEHLICVAQESI